MREAVYATNSHFSHPLTFLTTLTLSLFSPSHFSHNSHPLTFLTLSLLFSIFAALNKKDIVLWLS
jgi:hypothetical protein